MTPKEEQTQEDDAKCLSGNSEEEEQQQNKIARSNGMKQREMQPACPWKCIVPGSHLLGRMLEARPEV